MSTLYLVLPLALVIAALAVLAFAWSVRSGQLDDLDTPAHRLLVDDVERADFAPPASPPADLALGGVQLREVPHDDEVSRWHDS
jgi:cbb3-type cytochrome oxidase maturation protein